MSVEIPINVLVVDDDNGVRKMASTMFSVLGQNVTDVATPAEGIEIVESNPEFHQLILSDLEMPGMDGVEMLLQMQSIRRVRQITSPQSYWIYTGNPGALPQGGLKDAGIKVKYKPIKMTDYQEMVDHARQLIQSA